MFLIDPRQCNWILAAIAYYKARVEIYKLMIAEWEEELAQLTSSDSSTGDS